MEHSIPTLETSSLTAQAVSEIKRLHLENQVAFLAAGRGFLQRGIRIGELLQQRRQEMLDLSLRFLEAEFPKKHRIVVEKVEELERSGEDPTKLIAREFFVWFEESGLTEVFAKRTAIDYLNLYAHRETIELLDDVSSLREALKAIALPRPQIEKGAKEEKEQSDKESPIESLFKSFWNFAMSKEEWSEDEKSEYLHDLNERQTFAQTKGWL